MHEYLSNGHRKKIKSGMEKVKKKEHFTTRGMGVQRRGGDGVEVVMISDLSVTYKKIKIFFCFFQD